MTVNPVVNSAGKSAPAQQCNNRDRIPCGVRVRAPMGGCGSAMWWDAVGRTKVSTLASTVRDSYETGTGPVRILYRMYRFKLFQIQNHPPKHTHRERERDGDGDRDRDSGNRDRDGDTDKEGERRTIGYHAHEVADLQAQAQAQACRSIVKVPCAIGCARCHEKCGIQKEIRYHVSNCRNREVKKGALECTEVRQPLECTPAHQHPPLLQCARG